MTLLLRAASRRAGCGLARRGRVPAAGRSALLPAVRRAAFSTQPQKSDSFLSGASSIYAESMLDMYEHDPDSVPEVRAVDVDEKSNCCHQYLNSRVHNSK